MNKLLVLLCLLLAVMVPTLEAKPHRYRPGMRRMGVKKPHRYRPGRRRMGGVKKPHRYRPGKYL